MRINTYSLVKRKYPGLLATNSVCWKRSCNHPSGQTIPSTRDVNLTKEIAQAGKILGINLLDSLIVSKKEYYSFKEIGLLETIEQNIVYG